MNFEQARINMIKQQLRSWGVNDPKVLSIFADVPREKFVPEAYQDQAYADYSIPLSFNQIMFAPKQVAKMLQALDIQPVNNVLEIGTGTGFVSALLAKMAKSVHSIDIQKSFILEAKSTLDALGYTNITFGHQEALEPFAKGQDNYDIILISGAIQELPEHLVNYLNVQGRIVAILGKSPPMEAVLFTRRDKSTLLQNSLFELDAPLLETNKKIETFIF